MFLKNAVCYINKEILPADLQDKQISVIIKAAPAELLEVLKKKLMNIIQFLVFILVFSLIYLGINYFVFSQIISGLSLNVNSSLLVRLFFWLSAVTFLVGEFLSRRPVSAWAKPVSYYGSIWLGVISISVTVFFFRALLLILFRTSAFKYYSALFSIIAAITLSLFSLYNASRTEAIKYLTIETSKLPKSVSRFTVVQLSDLHLNYLKSPRSLKNIVEKTNSLDPDLVVITGDLIDADVGKLEKVCDTLKSLKSRYGIYAITGNHEFYAGLDKFYQALSCANIVPLRNEHRTIAGFIELVGIDDPEAERFLHEKIDLAQAFRTPTPVDPNKFVLFLSHRPDYFDRARKIGIDLQLSGHTHAGQIPPVDLLELLFYKYFSGLYLKDDGTLYTTSGTGYWGPPMRLSSRSEIVKITLENKKGPAK